jgi:hypothetical protein
MLPGRYTWFALEKYATEATRPIIAFAPPTRSHARSSSRSFFRFRSCGQYHHLGASNRHVHTGQAAVKLILESSPLPWTIIPVMASEKHVSTTRRVYTHRLSILLGLAVALVVLALGLGLGLGLGLKHHHHSVNGELETLSPQTSSNFIVGSIIGEPPQERNYNFTIQAANGAPDGVNKTMLVVNGASLW